MDEYTAEAWEAVLAPYSLAECENALRRVVTYQAFVAPADLVKECERARSPVPVIGMYGAGCGQADCACTHTHPCDRGMVPSQDTPGAWTWCGQCWPDKQPHEDERREAWIARLRRAKANG